MANFQNLAFGPWGRLRFQDLSLALATFLDTDMRRMEFHNVRWRPYQGRQAIYDEILLHSKGVPHAPKIGHELFFI